MVVVYEYGRENIECSLYIWYIGSATCTMEFHGFKGKCLGKIRSICSELFDKYGFSGPIKLYTGWGKDGGAKIFDSPSELPGNVNNIPESWGQIYCVGVRGEIEYVEGELRVFKNIIAFEVGPPSLGRVRAEEIAARIITESYPSLVARMRRIKGIAKKYGLSAGGDVTNPVFYKKLEGEIGLEDLREFIGQCAALMGEVFSLT